MCSFDSETGSLGVESTLREIGTLIETLAELSKAPLRPEEFYHEFLRRVVSALAAAGGIIWTRDASGDLVAAYEFGQTGAADDAGASHATWHRSSAAWVLARGGATAIAPQCVPASDVLRPNPTGMLLLFCPWHVEGDQQGVVEIAQRPGAGPDLERGYLRFLEVACQLLADYQRNVLLRDLRGRAAQWTAVESFTRQVHGQLDLLPTAFAIANEGRRLLGCDRVSVLVKRGSACRVVAVSGTESCNRRSNSVRLLEQLMAAALAAGDELWYPADGQRAPQVEELLNAYLDESHTRGLGILPLRGSVTSDGSRDAEIIAGVVIERFHNVVDDLADGAWRRNVSTLTAHSALALRNALDVETLPFSRLLRQLRVWGQSLRRRRLARTAAVVVVAAVAVAALLLVPGDFTVEARGALQPSRTCDIFAPDDGVVQELLAQSGASVTADEVLLVLRNPALELEHKRIWGELQTARTRLAAVESVQVLNRRADADARRRDTELTAQREELEALIAGLEAQYEIVQQQQSALQIRSPIDGIVLTWNAEQLLAARPVARGQVLLTVADLTGPWHVELQVPERRMRHLSEAQRQAADKLAVSFALLTDPAQVRQGRLASVGGRTETTESGGAVVWATVDVEAAEITERLPGAGVVARIHCGQRASGYVWLHDLLDFVRTWILF